MKKTNVLFLNDCAVDGCYAKSVKGKQMCKKHQQDYDNGAILIAFYGKKVQKKEFQSSQQQS